MHKNFAGSLGVFKSRGRTVALNFDWQGKKFCILTSHLHPYHDLEEYRKDLEDVKALTEMALDRIILWMVDAQTSLRAANEDGWLIRCKHVERENCKDGVFRGRSKCNGRKAAKHVGRKKHSQLDLRL